MRKHLLWRTAALATVAVMAIFLLGWVVMSLWNWLVPALFAGPVLTIWQALGLLILSKILLGGLRMRARGPWRRRMLKRWERMTPEERARFRQTARERCAWSARPLGETH